MRPFTLPLRNILVAMDFGEESVAALDYGAGLARQLDATLHIVHVTDADHRDLSHELMRLRAAADPLDGVTTRAVVLRSSNPAKALLAYARAKHINLILAGTSGREAGGGFVSFFRGTVGQNLTRKAPCPVMTMRAPATSAA